MKPDWIIHYILCEWPSSHTHGLNKYGSLELELNFPVTKEKAGMILNLLGKKIAEKGKRYQSGDREDDIFTCPCYFLETDPATPDFQFQCVLRILICDPQGRYPWETDCNPDYALQLNEKEKKEIRRLLYGVPSGGNHE